MRKGRDGGRKAPPPPTPGRNGAAARPDRDRGGGREHAPPSRALPSPPSPPEGEGWVLLGEFGRAHGLKGEVRLKSFTGDPAAIAAYGPLRTDRGPLLTLAKVRPAPGGVPDLLIAVVQGVASREAAEALNRTRLWIERDRLPPPEDEDEFLLADLIGLAVEKPDGTPLGTVVAVPNFGGGDLLEIAPQGGGPTALLPFTKAFVPVVEIANRRVVADAPVDLFAPARPEPDSPDEDPDASAERP